jgi:WD40 repeat protein
VRVWDARPDQQFDLVGRSSGPAVAAKWAGNAIVGLWSGGVHIYDARTKRLTRALPSEADSALSALGVSRDASVVAAGGVAGTTEVWDGRTGERLPAATVRAAVCAVAVSPRGDLVASGDRRGIVHVWRPRAAGAAWSASQHGAVSDIAFSSDGKKLVTAGPGGSVVSGRAAARANALARSTACDKVAPRPGR